MQTILVALDGSRSADKALGIALDLARQHKAKLVLLHVLLRDQEPAALLRLPGIAAGGPALAGQLKRLCKAEPRKRSAEEIMTNPSEPSRSVPDAVLREIATLVLEQGRARAAKARVGVEMLAPADGAAATAIAAAAAKLQADAIVMGSRGLRQIDSFTFGSVSQDVCRLAHCTCIAVH